MTTLVTGATGFVGSAVVKAMLALGEAGRDALDRYRRNGYLANQPKVSVSPAAAQ
jgi:uncharacterized protein YbjT (DUF2867 family)